MLYFSTIIWINSGSWLYFYSEHILGKNNGPNFFKNNIFTKTSSKIEYFFAQTWAKNPQNPHGSYLLIKWNKISDKFGTRNIYTHKDNVYGGKEQSCQFFSWSISHYSARHFTTESILNPSTWNGWLVTLKRFIQVSIAWSEYTYRTNTEFNFETSGIYAPLRKYLIKRWLNKTIILFELIVCWWLDQEVVLFVFRPISTLLCRHHQCINH